MRSALIAIAGLTLAASLPTLARAQGQMGPRDFAIRAGTVITMTGPELKPGVVIVRGGRIAAVGGADTPVPDGLAVVDAATRVVMPGFVEAHSQRGLDRTYETTADASFVLVSDALNPASVEVEDARRNGITTMLVAPDDRAFLGGRSAIVRPQGLAVDSMIVKADAALKISLQPQPGSSRMGHLAKLRQILADTRRFMDERKGRAADSRGDVDESKKALVMLLSQEIPAYVFCPTAEDVSTAFALAREHGFHVVPVLGAGAWRVAPLLALNHVTAILPPQLETYERQPDGTLLHVRLARILWEAKVPFALTTDPFELGPQHPWFQAALAVRQGVPRDVALEAITRTPARLLGFGRSKGVIEAGADADLVILSDDPLSGRAYVDESYARGARIYSRDEDAKLKRLLAPGTGEPPLVAAEDPHDHDDHPEEAPDGSPEREQQQRWPAGP